MLPFMERGVVENTDLGQREGGVKVSFVQNGSTLFSSVTASSGKYTLKGTFDYSKPYTIVFSKSGLVSKKVYFDFSRMNEEDIPAGDFRPVESLDMTLFKERENVDFSFLQTEPVAKFDWNTRQMAPRLDAVASTEMKNRILKLLAEADKNNTETELNYQKAIAAADQFYNDKNYSEALGKYEEALGYKPEEQYPADRIIELDALLQAQESADLAEKQENEEYYNLIEAADNLRDQDQLEAAVSKYNEALTKKVEQYPKDQIVAINKTIEDRKKELENQAKYEEAIKKADAFLKQNSLRAAKDFYTQASELKPSEQYPKDKLQEIASKIGAQEEQEAIKKKYNDAIEEADALYTSEDFTAAKAKYEEALTFESSATYPKERIKLCDTALEGLEAERLKAEQIEKLLQEGSEEIAKKEWETAKSKFTEVLGLESTNETAIEKLALVNSEIDKANDQALQEENYNKLIQEGDTEVTSEKYVEALAKYTEAKSIKTTPEVDEKIEVVNSKIKELEELADAEAAEKLKKESYDAAIAAADHAFDLANWDEAIAKYREALTFDDSQDYPTTRLSKIDELIAEEKANADKEAEDLAKQAAYDAAIAAGDAAFNSSNWNDAITRYNEALTFDDTQSYPTDQLTKIGELIAEEKANAEKEAENLAKKAEYDAAITSADAAFNSSNWDEAIVKYNEAKTIDDTQSYPSDQLAKIDQLIAEEKARADQEAEDLANKAGYDAAISSADAAFNSSNWEEAISKYNEAISFDNTQSYPADQLTKIESLIAEEQAAAEKLAEDAALKAKYDALIGNADGLFNSSKYSEAINKYREALLVDNSQTYPSDQITKIEKLISDQQSEAEQLAAEAKRQAEIANLLSEGQVLFSSDKLEDAKSKYQEVLIIESDNSIAKGKIEEINSLLQAKNEALALENNFNKLKEEGYELADNGKLEDAIDRLNQALEIKNELEVVSKVASLQEQLSSINAAQNENEKYQGILDRASEKEIGHDYQSAISLFEEALTVKPNEIFPQQKIDELKTLIAEEAEAKTKDEKYNKFMEKADDLMSHKDYLGAIQEYNNALSVKPSEQDPVDKAAEAERLEKAKDQDADGQYEKIITVAQKKIDGKAYDRAIELLKRAQTLRPADDRPEKMLKRIALLKKQELDFITLMKEGNDLGDQKKYQDAIAKFEEAARKKTAAIEPAERIAEMRRLMAILNSEEQTATLYNDYMDKGNSSMGNESYAMALTHYQNALSVKPNDIAALNKISEVQQIIDDISNAQNASNELQNKFDALVKLADESFSGEQYLPAKVKYEEALKLMPGDSYVISQIAECTKQERLLSVNQADKEYQKIIKAGDNKFDVEDYDKAKDYYKRALGFKPGDPYPIQRLAEIESILNPVSEMSAELQDLGDPFENSIMDGAFILAKASETRRSIKKTKIEKKYFEIQNEATKMSRENMADHYSSSNEIYLAYERISIDAGESNLNQDQIAAALRAAKLELENEDALNVQYEENENISDQIVLNKISEESAIEYGEKESVYLENTDIMKNYKSSDAIARANEIENDYESNIYSSGELDEINRKSALVYGEKEGVYRENTDKMNDYKTSDAIARSEEIRADYNTNLTAGTDLNVIQSKLSDGFQERYDERAEVAEGVKVIQAEATDMYTDYSSVNEETLLFSQGELDVIEATTEENAKLESIYAQNNSEALKKGNKELAEATDNNYYNETSKYQENKAVIQEEVKLSSAILDLEKEAHTQKVSYVERMDKKATIASVEGLKGDTESRMAAEKKINSIYTDVTESTSEESAKLEESNAALVSVDKTITAKESALNIGKKEDHYAAQEKLNNVSDEKKEKPIIANSLGEEYPEGVSQESFTRSDQDGLVTTIITRRVVVIKEHADVYVRTQTLNGITYSKNGKPSLSSTWNKETQGPHLERHF